MKKVLFVVMIASLMLSSCVTGRETFCPSSDSHYFYKTQGAKPFYNRH